MVQLNLSTVLDRVKAVTRTLRELPGTRVMVGVPSDDEQPHLGPGKIDPNQRRATPVGGVNNATLAYVHDNGSPAQNVPARPFMKPGVARAKERIVKRLEDAGRAALEGDRGRADRNFHAAGIEAVSSIRRVIAEGIPPPLAPATVAARRRRSKGSKYRRKATTAADTTPLIDTAQMLQAISYVVRKPKR